MDRTKPRAIRLLARLILVIASGAIIGWCFDIPFLISVTPNMTAMNPVTAITFLWGAIWLFVRTMPQNTGARKTIETVIGLVVLSIGCLKLLDYAGLMQNVHIDKLLFPLKLNARMQHNAIAPTTAILFSLSGILLLNSNTVNRVRLAFHDVVVIASFVISYLGIIGYIYSLEPFYRIGPFVPMALNTACCFAMLFTGIFLAVPEGSISKTIFSKQVGGKLMSRAIPLVLLIPPAFGYSRLFLQRAQFFNEEYSVALDTAIVVLAVLLLIYYYARVLNNNDYERKIAEDELQKSKDIFSNSFNYSGTGKALLAPGGNWIEVNKVICKLIGYTKEELLKLHYNDITYPDDIGIDSALIEKLVKREIPSYTIEKRYVSKGRKVIVALLAVTLVWDKDGTPEYFVCDIVDITQEKELQNLLQQKNVELQSTSDSLTDKIYQLEQLNHIIAHNFRGPIGNIKLLSEDPSIFPGDETLQMINRSSITLLNDLDDLLSLSQIKLNKNITYDVCNINDCIKNISTQLQGIIFQKNVKLVSDIELETINYPWVYLENILYNLISNAIKYSRTDIQPVICIMVKKTNDKAQLSVKDNGLGIDLEKYGDKVFKMNQIFHAGFDSKGVGLFITKTQIEALGGSIEVRSKMNEGAEFIVTF